MLMKKYVAVLHLSKVPDYLSFREAGTPRRHYDYTLEELSEIA